MLSDKEIKKLQDLTSNGSSVYYTDDLHYNKLISFGMWDEYQDGLKEPVAYFEDGKYIALWACLRSNFVVGEFRSVF